jgi:hypothetical protein
MDNKDVAHSEFDSIIIFNDGLGYVLNHLPFLIDDDRDNLTKQSFGD